MSLQRYKFGLWPRQTNSFAQKVLNICNGARLFGCLPCLRVRGHQADLANQSPSVHVTANAAEWQRFCCLQICASTFSTVTVCFKTTMASNTLGIDPALQR